MTGNQQFEGTRRDAVPCQHVLQRHVVIYAAALWIAHVSCDAAAMNAEQVFAQVSASVVSIEVIDENSNSATFGSGVIVGNGEVVTNCHVALQPGALNIKHEGRMRATLAYADEQRDLCLLNVPELTLGAAVLGRVRDLKPGQHVFAIGSPKGLELSISEGVISGLRRSRDSSLIQTTAAISPGSSGGGLFDENGRLVGITTFYIEGGQSLNFAIPADWIGRLRADSKWTSRFAQPNLRQPAPMQEPAPRNYGPIGFKDLLLGGSIAQHQQTYAMKCNPSSGSEQVSCHVAFTDPNESISYAFDPKNKSISTVAGVQVDFIDLLYEQGHLVAIDVLFHEDQGLQKVVEALSEKFVGTRRLIEKATHWAATCREDNFQITWNVPSARVRVIAAVATKLVRNAPLPCAVAWFRSKLEFKSDNLVKREEDAAKHREDARRKDL